MALAPKNIPVNYLELHACGMARDFYWLLERY